MADAFIGEIRAFSFGWAPQDWMVCDGTLAPLAQYQALYAVIGTNFGGDGKTTFGLPNLISRSPVCTGQGAGLSNWTWARKDGSDGVSLTEAQMPAHNHTPVLALGASSPAHEIATADSTCYPSRPYDTSASPPAILHSCVDAVTTPVNTTMAASSLGVYGAGAAHENRQPLLAMTFCICMIGWFPARPD
jgi:microcystin-dependent protein